MDHKEGLCASSWGNSSTMNESTLDVPLDHPSFSNFTSQQPDQKWEDPSILDYGIEPSFKKPKQLSDYHNRNYQAKIWGQDVHVIETLQTGKFQDWDPNTMLNNLSFLEQKIHQLQDLVHLIVGRRGQVLGRPDELVTQQQQLITADLTSIIAQLITTAGSILPSVKSATPSIGQLNGVNFPAGAGTSSGVQPKSNGGSKFSDQSNQTDLTANYGAEQNFITEDHESKDEDDADEGENLLPGTYEILQLEKEEILAPHTHFCTICGKGFKRDANLRMHMRGHGDEYKTPAALAKPHKEANSEPVLIKRYSCPYAGCKRNKDHKKFQPLKTILCVKNHYKRTHCDKSYTCSRCHMKKFSVIADLKTHEKHCGRDKWLCSCGTTFSRKDKLFGHIALFQGHTPAISVDEMKASCVSAERSIGTEATNNVGLNFSYGSTAASDGNAFENVIDLKGCVDDPTSYFSPMNYDTCNFGGFHEFPRPPFEDSESSFSFLLSGSCSYTQRSRGESSSNNREQC